MREAARQETETRVLAAADALFRERGFAGTTIRHIAEAAGVSVGRVIAVGDKSALLVTVFDRLIEQVHHDRRQHVAAGSTLDRIMALVDPFIELFASRPELARTYASILASGTHSSAVFAHLAEMLVAELRDVLGPGSDALAQTVYRAYLGTLFAWAAREHSDAVALREDLRNTLAPICRDDEETP